MKKTYFGIVPVISIIILLASCNSVSNGNDESGQTIARAASEVVGFGILDRIQGQWYGPVSTTTPAGSFPAWYVDFRAVLPGQVSQYSSLDADTINYMSLFIVERDGKLRVALRTEGVFRNQGCVTYELIDRVDESKGYYRFSDFKAGAERAYTEFWFVDDRMTMEVYTNRFNTVSPLEMHSRWDARLGSRAAAVENAKTLDFPRPVVVRDFNDAFRDMSESIYYEFANDPYPTSPQPFVGSVTIHIETDDSLVFESGHELFLLLTTESLFNDHIYDEDNLRLISRSVFLPVGTSNYTFENVHPGSYYLYSYNDRDGDKHHKSGDYMSSNIMNTFTLEPSGHIDVTTRIDLVIP